MRFPIWSPRTGYGCVATLIAGAVIAAAVYFVMGAPSFDRHRLRRIPCG
jgi:hypothetical protein